MANLEPQITLRFRRHILSRIQKQQDGYEQIRIVTNCTTQCWISKKGALSRGLTEQRARSSKLRRSGRHCAASAQRPVHTAS